MFLTDSKVGLGKPYRSYSVFKGFEDRVRHTLASHSGPSGNTPLDGVSLFRNRCLGLGTIVFLTDSKVGLGTPWRRIGNLPDTRR